MRNIKNLLIGMMSFFVRNQQTSPSVKNYELAPLNLPPVGKQPGVNRSKNRNSTPPRNWFSQKHNACKSDDNGEPCPRPYDGTPRRCCAFHLKQWRRENPGNGRYARMRWEHWSIESLAGVRRFTTQSFYMCLDGPFMVKWNPYFTEATLYSDRNGSWQIAVDNLFDCVIDAKRHADKLVLGYVT